MYPKINYKKHLSFVLLSMCLALTTSIMAETLTADRKESSPVTTTQSEALRWNQRRIDLRVSASEKTTSATYIFTNTSDKTVRITSVSTSCGCTAGKPDREVYSPGEQGELRIEFDIGSRRGVQPNWIDVQTDADNKPTRLDLVVTITDPLSLTPRLLMWTAATEIAIGDGAENAIQTQSKKAYLRFDPQETGLIQQIEIQPDAPWVNVEVIPPAKQKGANEQSQYILLVTPKRRDATLPWRSSVTITAQTEKLGPLKTRLFIVCR